MSGECPAHHVCGFFFFNRTRTLGCAHAVAQLRRWIAGHWKGRGGEPLPATEEVCPHDRTVVALRRRRHAGRGTGRGREPLPATEEGRPHEKSASWARCAGDKPGTGRGEEGNLSHGTPGAACPAGDERLLSWRRGPPKNELWPNFEFPPHLPQLEPAAKRRKPARTVVPICMRTLSAVGAPLAELWQVRTFTAGITRSGGVMITAAVGPSGEEPAGGGPSQRVIGTSHDHPRPHNPRIAEG